MSVLKRGQEQQMQSGGFVVGIKNMALILTVCRHLKTLLSKTAQEVWVDRADGTRMAEATVGQRG